MVQRIEHGAERAARNERVTKLGARMRRPVRYRFGVELWDSATSRVRIHLVGGDVAVMPKAVVVAKTSSPIRAQARSAEHG